MDLKKVLNGKNFKLLLLALIAVFIFRKNVVMLVSFIFFMYIGKITVNISKAVPHISAETNTPAAILMGYIFGWKVGLAYGLIAGSFGYISAGLVNLTTIIVTLSMALVGVLGGLFHDLNYSFFWAFELTYVIRALTVFTVMSSLQDITENIMHAFVESFYNMVVIVHFMNIFVSILKIFVGL